MQGLLQNVKPFVLDNMTYIPCMGEKTHKLLDFDFVLSHNWMSFCRCAHACGMRAISVATGLFSMSHLTENSPNLLLDNFSGFTAEDMIEFARDPQTAPKAPTRTSACGSSSCACMSAQTALS